jgi:large subunit ribosomal protein L35
MSLKTRKSVAKRFKVTGTGRVKRRSAGMRHLLSSKSSKRRRKLGKGAMLDKTDMQRVLQNLPFSH